MLRTFPRLVTLATALLALASPSRAAPAVAVPRWQPHDFTFAGPAGVPNPFLVRFEATVTAPDGRTFSLPGFFDGGTTWKLRVSPSSVGPWSLVTHSDAAALDNQRRSFEGVPNRDPAVHGGVRVDPARPHSFVYEDGSRYFPVGYECDWLWALDASPTAGAPRTAPTPAALPTLEPFLDKLAAHGFNFVILNTYAYDTAWRPGKTGPDDFGPPPLAPWEGGNNAPDFSRFNLAFWQHYDAVMAALNRCGLWAHVLVKVYNKSVNWPPEGSAADDAFWRWLVARYAAFPNLTWDFAKEANRNHDLGYKLARLRWLRANDPYHRLITVHDDRATYDAGKYDGIVDYRTDQQHQDWYEVMLRHRAQQPWPVINAEFGYEAGPRGLDDKTYGVAQSAEEVVGRAWQVCMAGGYPAYYYTYTGWDVIRPGDTPPGYAYFLHLRQFFEQTHYWKLEPHNESTTAGRCLAAPGREYVVYLPGAAPFALTVSGLAAPLPAMWFQPLTGRSASAGLVDNGRVVLTPPAGWDGAPLALHVGEPRRNAIMADAPARSGGHAQAPTIPPSAVSP